MKLLILGGGAVVTKFYLPALCLLDRASDVLVIEPSLDRIRNISYRFPSVQCKQIGFQEYLKGFSSADNFQAAIVALPNRMHSQAVEMALERGLHVLCEKPLTLDEKSCLNLARLSEEKARVLAVGMVRRLLPSVRALSEALKSGLIGSLEGIDIESGDFCSWPAESSFYFERENGGILADMGVHYLDLVQEVAGALDPISYQDDYKGGVEANFEFRLVLDKNIPVSLVFSRSHPLRNTAIFKGEQGELILEKDNFEFCLWRSFRIPGLITRIYPQESFRGVNGPVGLGYCFVEQLREFLEVACQGETSSCVTASQAANTMRLVEWAYNHRPEEKDRIPRAGISKIRPVLMPGKVVVTGGTGFIGGHLVSRLADLGFSDITVPVRRYQTAAEVARFPVKMPQVNLIDYNQVKGALCGSKFVVHLAYGRNGGDARAVTVKGTRNVVNAAIECKAECVVVLSTMYVFGHPDTESLVDESWPYHPVRDQYAISKTKMERWCLGRAKNSPFTRIVVLNPSCVYGPRGDAYTKLPLEMARDGVFCWIEEGRGMANYTFVDNLIDAIVLALDCKEAHGQRFIINDGFSPWREFLTPLLGVFAAALPSFSKKDLALMRRRFKSVKIKDLITHLASDLELIDIINRTYFLGTAKRALLKYIPRLRYGIIEKRAQQTVCLEYGKAPKKNPPEWLGDLFGPTRTRFSAEKAKKILGWRPLVPLDEGLEISRAWLKLARLL